MKKLALFILFLSLAFSQIVKTTTLEHNTTEGTSSTVKRIGNTKWHYAVTYRPNTDDFHMRIFSIDAATYAIAQTANYDFSGTATFASFADFWVIDSTKIIVAHEDAGQDGWITTLSVSTDKTTIGTIEAFEHDVAYGVSHRIEQIDATHYLIIYCDGNSDGMSKVIYCDANAANIATTTTFEFADLVTVGLNSTDLMRIGTTDDYFYSYANGLNIVVGVLNVNPSTYAITKTTEISQPVAAAAVGRVGVINDTHLALFSIATAIGTVKTYSYISPTLTMIDSVQLTGTHDYHGDFIKFDANNFLTASVNAFESFYINTDTYEITQASDKITAGINYYTTLDTMSATHAVVAYDGIGSDGYISVLQYTPPPAPSTGWAHTIGGVQTPSKVGGIEDFTKVGNVE